MKNEFFTHGVRDQALVGSVWSEVADVSVASSSTERSGLAVAGGRSVVAKSAGCRCDLSVWIGNRSGVEAWVDSSSNSSDLSRGISSGEDCAAAGLVAVGPRSPCSTEGVERTLVTGGTVPLGETTWVEAAILNAWAEHGWVGEGASSVLKGTDTGPVSRDE